MAGRIRSIKPELLDDEVAAGLSDAAWRLWVSSWVLADDHGNLRAGSKYLAANVWQDTGKNVDAAIEELLTKGRWIPYAVKGQRYAHIHAFDRHQRVDNAGKPRVPGPDLDDGTWNQSLTPIVAESSATQTGIPNRLPLARSSGETPTTDPDHRPRPPTPTTDPATPPTAENGTAVRTKRPSPDVAAVFDAWVAARKARHPRGPEPRLDESRAKVIRARLGEGHDVATLMLAVRGIWLSPWHLGENDRKSEYTDIKHAIGDAAKVEKFSELAARRMGSDGNSEARRSDGEPVPPPPEFIAVVKEFSSKKRVSTLFDEEKVDSKT